MFTTQHSTIPGDYEVTAIGARRRLEALAAIGYTVTDLAEFLNIDAGHFAEDLEVPPYKFTAVAALFDRLQLRPGTSERVRDEASERGWAPPLAWDEDNIDDPDAEPQGVPPRGYRRCNRTPPDFADMVLEHRELGRFDEEIADSMNMSLRTLHKRLHRAGLPQRSRGVDGTGHLDMGSSAAELARLTRVRSGRRAS